MTGSTTLLAPSAPRDEPRARSYGQARRHSARVRFLKIAIPSGALLAAALVAAAAYFNPFGKVGGLTLGPISLSGSKIAMQNPRLTGYRKDNRAYEVTATAAFQDVRKPTVVELKDMQAKMATDAAGATARLSADLGFFDTTKEQLELSRDVHIVTDKGDEVMLKSALVDFKAGTVVSNDPVRITTPNATIEAAGVQVSENGRTFGFTGRVRTTFSRDLLPGGGAGGPDAPGTARAAGASMKQAEAGRP